MVVEMRRNELIRLLNAKGAINGVPVPAKFAYALAKTAERVKPEAVAMAEAEKAMRDKHGEDADAFEAEWQSFVNETVEVEVHQFAAEHLPAELPVGVMDALLPLVMEGE